MNEPQPPRWRRWTGFMARSDGRLGHRILRSGGWVAISMGGRSALQIVRSMVLARLLSPEAFGLMNLCQVVLRALELFTETGIGAALIQRPEREDRVIKTAFALQALRGLALGAIASLIAPFAALFYAEAQLREILFVMGLVFAITGLINIRILLLQKDLDFRRLAPFELIVAILSTTATIGLAFWLHSVWALVLGQVVNGVITVGLSYWMLPTGPTWGYDKTAAKELLSYGKFITGFTIVQFFTSEIDNLVIGKVLGMGPLGVYGMAFLLANLPATHIAKVAAVVLFPAYSAVQGDPRKVRIAYLTALRGIVGVAAPVAAGLAALAPEAITIGFGPKWAGAITPMRILLLYGIARALSVVGGILYNAIGKPHLSMYQAVIKLVLIVTAIYPATVYYGLNGAACAMALPQLVVDSGALWVVKTYTGVPLGQILAVLGKIALRTGIMVAVVLLLRAALAPIVAWELVALVVAGALVYFAASYREILDLRSQLAGRG
jgi:O-antigen/teichoic acid export membrane protein